MMESLTYVARHLDDSDQRQDLLLKTLQLFIQQGIAAKRASDTTQGSHKVGEEEGEEEEVEEEEEEGEAGERWRRGEEGEEEEEEEEEEEGRQLLWLSLLMRAVL